MTNHTMTSLLEKIDDKDILIDQEKIPAFMTEQQKNKSGPLYLKLLLGFGAFLSAIFLIGFLFLAGLISEKHQEYWFLWGLAFIATAIQLHRMKGHDEIMTQTFLAQSSLASMAIGKILFVYSIAHILDTSSGFPIALLIATGMTYYVYKVPTDRFLSSFCCLVAILMNIFFEAGLGDARAWFVNGFFLCQLTAAAYLFTHDNIKPDYRPLTYALILSLCATVLLISTQSEFNPRKYNDYIQPYIMNFLLTGGLISLLIHIVGDMKKIKTLPIILACCGTAFLGAISAPGILLAISLMVVGYDRHDRYVTWMGLLLVPVFLFYFYYSLDITLLQKSAVLFGSGIVLLTGYGYMKFKKWDQGDQSCA